MSSTKLSLICLITALVLLSGCKQETEDTEPEVTEQPEVPETPAPEPQSQPSLPETQEPVAEVKPVAKLDMITEARCLDNRIELVLTNPTDSDFVLGRTAKILLNGMVVPAPECDKMEIAAGESVYCPDISGNLAIRQGEVNRLQVNMEQERGVSDIRCT